ncbi:hypothetical protein [Maribacter flavus]|uniref:Uncharacterized protein n=1 Tax=Maribacter flavus TaxID=1658664 RepID=A0A5B2TWA3_9FLAO|nr:hypothetical protein [Maribacter flavus]KAA2218248.1 hypothetical protein F0361_01110 [Maribacter flavus]
MNIEYIGDNAIVEVAESVFTFEVSDNPRSFDSYRVDKQTLDWTDNKYHLGNWRVFPYGNDNQLPKQIRDIVQQNYIAPGLVKKKTQWLWGKGPKLYIEKIENKVLIREWVEDKEIQEWLQSWDYEDYLTAACVDFNHIEGVFTKFYRSRGGRVGQPSIAKLEHCMPDRSRLACDLSSNEIKPTHVVVTDWNFEMINAILNPKIYPIFDFKNPFEHKNAIYYSNMYSFCSDYYTVPDIYGSFEWLRRSTAIPLILKALSKNSLNVKYHVISPQKFWDDRKTDMEEEATKQGKKFREKDFVLWQSAFLKKIAKVLSGEENTGKFWHTTKDFTVEGTNLIEHGWEIKVIDQKVKDFIDAQIEISKRADHAVSSGIGIGNVLGNVSESGRSNGGSERIYAMKEYLQTGIDIPEMIVCKAINFALRANWPNKNVKIGFYHISPQREEDITPSDRIKNQGE